MVLLYGLISLLLVTIGVIPYLNSFAYIKKNVFLHIISGALLAIINSKVGFVGVIDNIFYLLAFFFITKNGLENFEKKNPDMNDALGHNVVREANYIFMISYSIVYIFLNIRVV